MLEATFCCILCCYVYCKFECHGCGLALVHGYWLTVLWACVSVLHQCICLMHWCAKHRHGTGFGSWQYCRSLLVGKEVLKGG